MKPDSRGPWVALYAKTLYSKTFNLLTCVERSVFLQSLFMASRMEYDCLYNGHYYHLLPGQLVVSQRDLAEKCGRDCSRQIVRDTISKLVACGTITHSRAKSGTQSPSLITFINWDVYQRPLTHTTQSRTHSSTQLQPTDGIQPLINGGENASLQGSYKVDTQYNTQTRLEDKDSVVTQKRMNTKVPLLTFDPPTQSVVGELEEARQRFAAAFPKNDFAMTLEKMRVWIVKKGNPRPLDGNFNAC